MCRAALVAWVRAEEPGFAPPADEVPASSVGTGHAGDVEAGGSVRSPEPTTGSVYAGRYVVQRKLGSGAMGLVFAARDRMLDRRTTEGQADGRAAGRRVPAGSKQCEQIIVERLGCGEYPPQFLAVSVCAVLWA